MKKLLFAARLYPAIIFLLVISFSNLFSQSNIPELKIHYLGHSSFVLQFDNGINIVTDYGKENAYLQWGWDSPIYELGELVPDIMTYSHFHEDHYDSNRIPLGVNYILAMFDSLIIDGISIKPIRVCEGTPNSEDNSAYLFTYKGKNILHLADAQAQIINIEDEDVCEHINEIIPDSLDLLLMTIEGQQQFIEEAELFIDLLKPKRIIPMHYWSTEYKKSFLAYLKRQNIFGKHYEFENYSGSKYDMDTNESPSAVKVISLEPGAFQEVTPVKEDMGQLHNFRLDQNYPNPFNPTTVIEYSLPAMEPGHNPALQTILTIYDILGGKVTTLVNGHKKPGSYKVTFDASGLSSGLYFYQLTADKFSQTRKMILAR